MSTNNHLELPTQEYSAEEAPDSPQRLEVSSSAESSSGFSEPRLSGEELGRKGSSQGTGSRTKRLSSVPKALLTLLALTAHVNVFPLPAILVVSLITLATLIRLSAGKAVPRLARILLLNYAYWTLSLIVVAAVSISDVATFDFIRNDGRSFFAYLPILFVLTVRTPRTTVLWVLTVWLFSATAVALLGILEYVGILLIPGQELTESTNGVRFFVGLQRSHNAAGSYYTAVALTWGVLLFAGSRRSLRLIKWPLQARTLRLMTAIVMVAALLAGSRAAYAGLILAGLTIASQTLKEASTKRALLVATVGAVLVVAASPTLRERILETDVEEHNVAVRLELWQQAPELFSQSPLVGIGYSRWNDVNQRTGELLPLEPVVPGLIATGFGLPSLSVDDTAHNSYLMLLAEQGTVGLLLMLSFWRTVFVELRKRSKLRPDDELLRLLALAGTGLVAFLCAISLVGHSMASPTTVIALTFPIGLALSMDKNAPCVEQDPKTRRG